MPARLRVRRRSLNAPRARRSAQPARLPSPFGAAGFSPPTSRLRLRGVRATRGASAERGNYLCSTPSSRDGVEGVFCVSEARAARGHAIGRVNAGPSPRPPVPILLASQRSQGRYSVVVRDLSRHGSATTFQKLYGR